MMIKYKMYFPETIFKNILDFCGEPLPKNKFVHRFNCKITKRFFRGKDGKIYSLNEQLRVRCKICNNKFYDTGYPNCRNCYRLMGDLSLERKCLDCDTTFKPKFKGCWKCVKCYYKNKKSSCCLLDSDED